MIEFGTMVLLLAFSVLVLVSSFAVVLFAVKEWRKS